MLKSAEQVLEDIKAEWKKNDPRMQGEAGAKKAMIDALVRYAEQAIDQCAESAKVSAGIDRVVDKESILKVKDLLQ
jgi:hypothetical protein